MLSSRFHGRLFVVAKINTRITERRENEGLRFGLVNIKYRGDNDILYLVLQEFLEKLEIYLITFFFLTKFINDSH